MTDPREPPDPTLETTTPPTGGSGSVPPAGAAGSGSPATEPPPTPATASGVAGGFAPPGYAILGELGRGGMGVVYRAWDRTLRREVAIKVAHGGAGPDSKGLARLRREATAAAQLRHPGIVAVHEGGVHEGRPYLVLELVEGAESLEAALRRAPLAPREVARVVREVALALAHAHERGVVHRDVKPENVLLERDGRARLVDFGLARDESATERLTTTGELLGTPAYMAPEQVRGDPAELGPATDVYGLGGILYRALTGRPPFRASSAPALLKQVLFDAPVRPRRLAPGVHADLETIALRCLAKEPGWRYREAAGVAEDLRRFLNGEPILARPVSALERLGLRLRRHGRWLVALVLGAALAAGGTAAGLRGWEDARRREARQRRLAEVEAALEAARGRPLPAGSAEERAVLEALARDPGPEVAARLEGELRGLTAAIGSALRASYSSVQDDPPRLEGLDGAVEAWLAREPGAPLGSATARLLGEAGRRLEARADEGRPAALRPAPARVRVLLASAQEAALGPQGAQRVRLVCEALARAGGAAQAPALVRYLAAEEDDLRAATAAEALCLLSPRGAAAHIGPVLGRAREIGTRAFQERVARLLDPLGERASVEGHVLRGVIALGGGDPAGAVAALGSALTLEPDHAEALGLRALARRELGDLGGAIADADRALELDPGQVKARMARAGARLRRGEARAAIADVESAVALAPFSPEALLLRGEARLVVGEPDRAGADFQRALELDPRSTSAWLAVGALRRSQGDGEGALQAFTRALELDPQLATAWLERGTVRALGGDLDAAMTDITRAIELRPGHAPAWSNRADVRRRRGDAAGALADLTRALELDPRDAPAHCNLGLTRLGQGQVQAAIRDLDRALELDPRLVPAWLARGTARRSAGDLAGAIADLSSAIALAPGYPGAWFNRGNARRMSGDLDGAEADYSRSIELDGAMPDAWRSRGVVREQRGDLAGALADFGRAIELAPRFALAWSNRAWCRESAGDPGGALEDCTRALELDPRLAPTRALRARLRTRAGDLTEALADYDLALEHRPGLLDARAGRGLLRLRLGDRAGARGDLERYLAAAPPGHPDLEEARRALLALAGE